MKTPSNEQIAAERLAAKRRQRRAEWAWQEASERPAENERQAGRENIDAIRSIDRAAADALVQLNRWREIVTQLEVDDPRDELVRARRVFQEYRKRWVTLAATHPRLEGLVEPQELGEFRGDLASPAATARRLFNAADGELETLRARADAGEDVDPAEIDRAAGVRDVALTRHRLELDSQIHAREDERRDALGREGERPPLGPEERERLERRREDEAFVQARLGELLAGGLDPDVAAQLNPPRAPGKSRARVVGAK